MADPRTLLERLRAPDRMGPLTAGSDGAHLAGSVLDNLRRVLNTVQGSSATRPDYGLPHLSEFAHELPEAFGKMEEAIQRAIERFEPRLERVRVKAEPVQDAPLTLSFTVTGQLVQVKDRAAVRFKTTIDASGRVLLQG